MSSPQVAAPTRAAKIDEFGELDRQLSLLEPRYKVLAAEIRSWSTDQPAAEAVSFTGKSYTVQLTACAKKRSIFDTFKALQFLKRAVKEAGEELHQVVTIPFGVLDKYVPEALHAQCVSEERTGARLITAVPLAPPAKKPA
jgi:hypothetical protein